MKTIFRLSMVLTLAALFIWGGVAEPAEVVLEGTNYEYLIAMDRGTLPGTPVENYKMEAVEVAAPEFGTWEYFNAIPTGSIPSTCANEPCGPETFPIEEYGGVPFRVPIDLGP